MTVDHTAPKMGDDSPKDSADTALDRPGQDGQMNNSEIQAFIAQLSEGERMLILLKKELYEGSWQAMMTDLDNRLNGKPFIFKLANRIRDDMERIEKLRNYEKQNNIDLAEYVEPPRT